MSPPVHYCEHPGCEELGGHGFGPPKIVGKMRWFCWEHARLFDLKIEEEKRLLALRLPDPRKGPKQGALL